MFGIKDFAAVINPPHATILAVGAGLQQPVVKNGKIKAATVMTVTLSTDHPRSRWCIRCTIVTGFQRIYRKTQLACWYKSRVKQGIAFNSKFLSAFWQKVYVDIYLNQFTRIDDYFTKGEIT